MYITGDVCNMYSHMLISLLWFLAGDLTVTIGSTTCGSVAIITIGSYISCFVPGSTTFIDEPVVVTRLGLSGSWVGTWIYGGMEFIVLTKLPNKFQFKNRNRKIFSDFEFLN